MTRGLTDHAVQPRTAGAETLSTSCDPLILMDPAADVIASSDVGELGSVAVGKGP